MLKKVIPGSNMYQGWITHTWSVMRGACPHRCSYCYVPSMMARSGSQRYTGPVELIETDLHYSLGEGRTIFVEHMQDLWADAVPNSIIVRVLHHCSHFPNTYVFQTKNPSRYGQFTQDLFPDAILGTTIESNRDYRNLYPGAPNPKSRYWGMQNIPRLFRTFVTVEPILDFDVDELFHWLERIRPAFVNIGADSKGHNLPEPGPDKVHSLLYRLSAAGIEVRRKPNLIRLLHEQ